ncbi:MAG: alpha/beta hydrolase [Rhodoferax sp.]
MQALIHPVLRFKRTAYQDFAMLRRLFSALAVISLFLTLGVSTAQSQERIGVLLLHGKNPGSNLDPNSGALKGLYEQQGWLVIFPDMPWSRARYLDGDLDKAMAEMGGHIKSLRDQGATKIVITGFSMGAPAAMAYAARGGDVDALVLLAPGHVPLGYYTYPTLKIVRESIDEARALVAAGKGNTSERFSDINQGRRQVVVTTAADYLSWFDPTSDAEMSVTAPRIPANVAVMTVVGEKDPLFSHVKAYFVDKLPMNPKNSYLEVTGGHLDTPRVSSDALVAWIKRTFGP